MTDIHKRLKLRGNFCENIRNEKVYVILKKEIGTKNLTIYFFDIIIFLCVTLGLKNVKNKKNGNFTLRSMGPKIDSTYL